MVASHLYGGSSEGGRSIALSTLSERSPFALTAVRTPATKVSSRIKSPMPDEKPITDPEKIAAYVRSARIVYGLDGDEQDSGKIDSPPIVVPTMNGAAITPALIPR